MNISNSCGDTNSMPLFWAKALDLFGFLEPRPEGRGNSNKEQKYGQSDYVRIGRNINYPAL